MLCYYVEHLYESLHIRAQCSHPIANYFKINDLINNKKSTPNCKYVPSSFNIKKQYLFYLNLQNTTDNLNRIFSRISSDWRKPCIIHNYRVIGVKCKSNNSLNYIANIF